MNWPYIQYSTKSLHIKLMYPSFPCAVLSERAALSLHRCPRTHRTDLQQLLADGLGAKHADHSHAHQRNGALIAACWWHSSALVFMRVCVSCDDVCVSSYNVRVLVWCAGGNQAEVLPLLSSWARAPGTSSVWAGMCYLMQRWSGTVCAWRGMCTTWLSC